LQHLVGKLGGHALPIPSTKWGVSK